MASTQSLLVSSLKEGPGEWRLAGACVNTDPQLFYPEGDSAGYQPQIETAKGFCRCCPVQELCLEHALVVNEQLGIWGGMTEKERRGVRRARMAGTRPRKTEVLA